MSLCEEVHVHFQNVRVIRDPLDSPACVSALALVNIVKKSLKFLAFESNVF